MLALLQQYKSYAANQIQVCCVMAFFCFAFCELLFANTNSENDKVILKAHISNKQNLQTNNAELKRALQQLMKERSALLKQGISLEQIKIEIILLPENL